MGNRMNPYSLKKEQEIGRIGENIEPVKAYGRIIRQKKKVTKIKYMGKILKALLT